MRVYRPAGERRVRVRGAGKCACGPEHRVGGECQVHTHAETGCVVEVDAGSGTEEWQAIASAKTFFEAERIRVAIVQTIAAEVAARFVKR